MSYRVLHLTIATLLFLSLVGVLDWLRPICWVLVVLNGLWLLALIAIGFITVATAGSKR